MPEVPSEALEAGDAALRDYLDNFPGWKPRGEAEVLIEAAYPHIRRAVIEELIAKAENPGRLDHPAAYRKATDARAALSFLRAELDGEG